MRTSKQYIIFSLLILSICCYDELMAVYSSCGDWEPYKEEKCFKIFDVLPTQTYEDAEKACQQQDHISSSSLISIRFREEQEFVSNFLKTKKIADDVWIGVKYTNNKYKWTDDSDLVFNNWEQGSPKNKTDHCVQMNTAESSFGKWSEVPCNRKNLVVCQKMQTWSLFHVQKLLLNTIKNPVPIGFIYVQLPNKKSPTEIWPWMTWKDITSAYAGLFFRAEGGGSEPFGVTQSENSPRITDMKSVSYWVNLTKCDENPDFSSSEISCLRTGLHKGGDIKYQDSNTGLKIKISHGEVRPRNMAIRVWERTG